MRKESKLTKINQSLQIAAIIAAGIWAIWTFSKTVMYKLETNFSVSTDLQSDWLSERNTCVYTFALDITNNSLLKKEVSAVNIKAAWFPYPAKPEKGQFHVFDVITASDEYVDIDYESKITGDYPPEANYSETFEILTEPVPGEIMFIQAQIMDENNEEIGASGAWAVSCEITKKEKI